MAPNESAATETAATRRGITYDASRVRSAVMRRRVEGALDKLSLRRSDDVWGSLQTSRGRLPEGRAVVVGDLHQVVASGGLDDPAVGSSLLSYVVLVRTSLDRRLLRQADIALRLSDEKYYVLDLCECGGGEGGCAAMLSDYFHAFLERLQPDRVRTARFSSVDDVVWLEFGDGLARAVAWSSLPFASQMAFAPVSASVREQGQSVVFVDAAGGQRDIDSGVLRSAVDRDHRDAARRRHAAERAATGETIRRIRENLGLSQEETARRSGIPQESLSRIENGHRDPRLDTLRRLASGFRIDVSELLSTMSGE
jgi:DNA-binding XRE family transcriptional regulator